MYRSVSPLHIIFRHTIGRWITMINVFFWLSLVSLLSLWLWLLFVLFQLHCCCRCVQHSHCFAVLFCSKHYLCISKITIVHLSLAAYFCLTFVCVLVCLCPIKSGLMEVCGYVCVCADSLVVVLSIFPFDFDEEATISLSWLSALLVLAVCPLHR